MRFSQNVLPASFGKKIAFVFAPLQFVCPFYSCLLTLLTVTILLAGRTEDVFLGTVRSGGETDYSPTLPFSAQEWSYTVGPPMPSWQEQG
jgi:hypothetical protein